MAKLTKKERRPVDELREHPAQQALFGHTPEHEIRELAADIAANGLKHPIVILPDGTVIAGHNRLLAVKLLGWTEVDVIVRTDLADDPEAAERELITDNLVRRQLRKLAIARLYARRIELDLARPIDPFEKAPRINLAEQLAERLGCSRRNLDRYLAVLRAPIEVQQAFDDGHLSLSLAARAAALPPPKRDRIAAAILAGTNPSTAIRAELPTQRGSPENVQSDYSSFLRLIECLAANVDQVMRSSDSDLETLRRGAQLIEELLQAPTRRRKCPKRPARTTPPSGY